MKTVDLFSGCGGMSLGFQNEGFDVVAAFDSWDTAVECYANNFKHPVFNSDLSDVKNAVKEIKKFNPEVVIGGPPCQDFSTAGKRVEADRANLTECYAEIVAAIRPKFFVMENVARARLSEAYSVARKTFKESGYGLTEIVLDASLCGVPQKRKRFVCFGVLGKEDAWALDLFVSRLSKVPTTVRDYFGDSLGLEYYYRHPRNYNRRGVYSIDEPAPTMRGVNRPVPKGYPGRPNDPCKVDETLRSLSTEERAQIQTFPSDFRWIGCKTDVEQMIGNAVPVVLARFVAQTIKTALKIK